MCYTYCFAKLAELYGNAIPFGELNPVLAPEMVLAGAILPLSVLPYTVIESFPLTTKISLFTVSTAMPAGVLKPVLAPKMVLAGPVSPLAGRRAAPDPARVRFSFHRAADSIVAV